ncbi:FAD:protein FMN transferase [Bacteroides fragilis]|nr:FAD:protein FMN transferase [Bacteroides fragilis]
MEKKTRKSFIWLAILLLGTIWILAQRNKQIPYNSINGLVFGTVYNITYQYDGNLKAEIDAELKKFDGSLSPFNDTSVITRVNRNEEIVTDTFFQTCFNRSMEISAETSRSFRYHSSSISQCLGIRFQKRSLPRLDHDR